MTDIYGPSWQERAEAAEAEVERLKAALAEIGRINSGGGDAHEMRMATIAVCRQATEGEDA